MATDFEQLLKELLGDSMSKFSQFQGEQTKRISAKLHDLAREALKDEFSSLHTELADLRQRVMKLETERVQQAAESTETTF